MRGKGSIFYRYIQVLYLYFYMKPKDMTDGANYFSSLAGRTIPYNDYICHETTKRHRLCHIDTPTDVHATLHQQRISNKQKNRICRTETVSGKKRYSSQP